VLINLNNNAAGKFVTKFTILEQNMSYKTYVMENKNSKQIQNAPSERVQFSLQWSRVAPLALLFH
jgi:hypothetical protein